MQANKTENHNRPRVWYPLVFLCLFFVIASFYANKNHEVSNYNCDMEVEATATEGLQQFIPGLWQITY